MGVRVRWGIAARVALPAVAAVVALQALPALLKAPEPRPLPADVGLPGAAPAAVKPRAGEEKRAPSVERRVNRPPRPESRPASRRRGRPPVDRAPTSEPPPIADPPAPEALEIAPAATPPSPPPPPPGDGSEEFAPR